MAGDLRIVQSGLPAAEAPPRSLSDADLATLAGAVRVLEGASLVGRLSTMAGKPLDLLGRALPEQALAIIGRATDAALRAGLKVALTTLPAETAPRSGRFDTLAAAATGAAGGALGLATLPFELPVSTVLMLRVIAGIAREEGEDLSDPASTLACLEVFALGGRTEADDGVPGGYLAVRGMLAKTVSQAARIAAAQGVADASAPAFVRFVAQIAGRFGLVVSQKVAAGAVPLIGAVGGAAVNAAFLEHFRGLARAHFTVRRLERAYGQEVVAAAYRDVAAATA